MIYRDANVNHHDDAGAGARADGNHHRGLTLALRSRGIVPRFWRASGERVHPAKDQDEHWMSPRAVRGKRHVLH